jgi:hypothetical protein
MGRDQEGKRRRHTGLVVGIVWNFWFVFVCVERRKKRGGIQSKKKEESAFLFSRTEEL